MAQSTQEERASATTVAVPGERGLRYHHDPETQGGKPPVTPEKKIPAPKRLGIKDMVSYGMIMMVPIAPFALYASIFQTSNGMPALSYLIGAVGMLFTVFSFGVMIPLFPSSGSIYTYASQTISPAVGFVAGWLMLLQYLITPDLMFIQAGQALNQYLPEVPVWAWCLIFLTFVTCLSIRSLGNAIKVEKVALVCEIVVFAMFIVFGVVYIFGHPATSGFTLTALVDPSKIEPKSLMGSVSLGAMSFVGFGCVATLTEEAKDPKKGPAKSMLIIVVILACMFVGMCYVATCVDPTGSIMAGHADTGFYLLAGTVGGPWFGVVCAVANAIALGAFTGLTATTSISRVLYVMSRSGALPKELGIMDKKTGVPQVATLFVCALSLVMLLFLIPLGMTQVAKLSNFGALSTYCLLNICVIWYAFGRKQVKLPFWRSAVLPVLGALVTGAILFSIDPQILFMGWGWVLLGVIYYLVQTRVFKHEIDFG
ncbi:APC family permease [Caniella muris]|uniref:APC family permease n=1 Tax=Caniella muris TaxID=2941502 RepID=UPI00203F5A77|nr:APC family permease [Caniella muris]